MGQIPMIFLDSWIFLEYFLHDQKASIAGKIIASIENANKGVTIDIAKLAASLRVKYYSSARQLSFIDAINLATAILASCDKFFTGDKDFIGVNEISAVVI